MKRIFVPFFFVLIFVLLACSPDKQNNMVLKWHEESFKVFNGIPARILFALEEDSGKKADSEKSKLLKQQVHQVFADINQVFNAFSKSSELYKLNQTKKADIVKLSAEMLVAFQLALKMHEDSNQAFDITVLPLKKMWKKALSTQQLPTDMEINNNLALVGLNKLNLEKDSVIWPENGFSLDFGGLIKGYAVDKISAMLKSNGVKNGLVQCGGEIKTWGKNKNADSWRIGIQHPFDMTALFGSVKLADGYSISTSGNYRQAMEIGNTVYYHIFDPRTGQPVSIEIAGVTVLMKGTEYSNAKADAWATAMAVIGPDKGLLIAEKLGFDILFILKNGGKVTTQMTKGFEEKFSQTSCR